MFGFCQNVEIIHEHHHHFYPSSAPPNARGSSALSRTMKPNFSENSGTLSGNRSHLLHQSHTSKFYHSKRSYLNKSHRGIEVICKRGIALCQNQGSSFQGPKNTSIKQHTIQTLHQNQLQQNPNTYRFLLPSSRSHLQTHFHTIILEQIKENKKEDHLESSQCLKNSTQKMEMSTPSIKIHLPSQGSSSRTKKYFINTHQLRQSVIGFPNTNIYQTKKIHREIHNKNQQKVSLFIPVDSHKRSLSHRNAETCREINDDKNSMLTQKQTHFLKIFKTQRLLDDAKSIVSHQSCEDQCLNIEESIIVSRSMDYFCHLTAEVQLPNCKMYLAKDNKINWVVSIRLFQFQHENSSFKESQLFDKLHSISEKQQTHFSVLQLYKVLVEGVPPHKNIIFVLEPYEILLQQYLNSKKMTFRASPSMLTCFLNDLSDQIFCALMHLNQHGFSLWEPITIRDIVMVNGKYKFHSLAKFDCTFKSSSVQMISGSLAAFIKMVQTIIKWY